MILKVTDNLMSTKSTKKNHIYFILWLETGYWYKINVCPNLTEDDDIAINYMEHITETGMAPSVPPVDEWYERAIRDNYLPKVITKAVESGLDTMIPISMDTIT